MEVTVPAAPPGKFVKVSALNPISGGPHKVLGYVDSKAPQNFEIHAEQTLVLMRIDNEDEKQRDEEAEAEIARALSEAE